ncbi:hypothetical protein SAMN05444007_108228 [Cribrihabitans marinus]|uniref:Uncharacterized protein n=1 Tax=Cribrihabitans marinus TaxID=1227549 RepID=A0A1H7CVG8_9RHOB|nr:hypothetical protein [Cribrihabitans marinus]GGH36156.1 hypothetical protein GCM10010973_29960 [Cribrihabitans marinus]SEJ91202.1 hypothetical protein SAMN05444007_108228 [Cribrihabitans marinus]
MAEPQLTSQDHLLASALTALVTNRIADRKREGFWLGMLTETLPHASRAHSRVVPLIEAAERLVEAGDGPDRAWAHLKASAAVCAWSEWRMARAQEVISKREAAA